MNELKQGTRIGSYTVLYALTNRAYTQTYCVADQHNDQYFMKVYDLRKTPDALMHNDLPRELRIYRELDSCPNLLHVLHHGRERTRDFDIVYFITPFFRGKLLSQLIDEHGVLPSEQALPIALGITQAVAHMNQQNICHLDITPQNILLSADETGTYTPILFDFEHAIEFSDNRTKHCAPAVINNLNLYYCHARLLSKSEADDTTDAFSIGAVIYTMLSGHKPWSDCPITRSMPPAEQHLKMCSWRDEHSVDELIADLRPTKQDITQAAANLFVAMQQALGGKQTAQALQNILLTKDTDLEKIASNAARLDARSADQLKGFASIAGMDKLKQNLYQHVIWPLQHKDKAQQYRLQLPNGILLYGPPGCGKTYFAAKLSEELGWKVKFVTSASLGSSYQHETQSNIKNMFDTAAAAGHCVLCIDEIDGILGSRSGIDQHSHNDEVNEFLAHFSECHKRGILVVGTTNRRELVDPAALRAGRFDVQIEIPAPDDELRQRLFEMYLRNRPLADDLDISELVRLTKNYASSDIPFVVNEAALAAAMADEPIAQHHLLNSIHHHPSSLHSTRRPIGFEV